MMAIAWASVGAGAGAKRLANVTAPTNQLLGAECGEFCSWNNVNQILATAMDVGERWKFPVGASLVMFRIIDEQQHEPQPVSPRPSSTSCWPALRGGRGEPIRLLSNFFLRGHCSTPYQPAANKSRMAVCSQLQAQTILLSYISGTELQGTTRTSVDNLEVNAVLTLQGVQSSKVFKSDHNVQQSQQMCSTVANGLVQAFELQHITFTAHIAQHALKLLVCYPKACHGGR